MKRPIFPSIGIDRLRMATDGDGVTTLVCAQGCPLRCKYCINPQSSISKKAPRHIFTPSKLYDALKIDSLYFLATGGGVTFGGGEPLLYPDFIAEFASLAPDWKIYVETSLSVNPENLKKVIPHVDCFFVDIKDTDPEIYKAYTGRDIDRAITNLSYLAEQTDSQKIIVRLPRIPGYNDDNCRSKSEEYLRKMGITRFNRFDYRIKEGMPLPAANSENE